MGLLDMFKKPVKPRGIQKRNYAAAARWRLFADFNGSNRSADSEIRWALNELRNVGVDTTLIQLSRKAGLDDDAWQDENTHFHVFKGEWFGEDD